MPFEKKIGIIHPINIKLQVSVKRESLMKTATSHLPYFWTMLLPKE